MACVSAASAATTRSLRAQNLGAVPVSSLAAQLNLGPDMTLAPQLSIPLAGGRHVVRQQQMYRGVPVYGRSIAVLQDAQGNALRATGELMQGLQAGVFSVTPRLAPAAAIDALRAHAHTVLVGGASMSTQQSELFVYPQENAPARLVYRVS